MYDDNWKALLAATQNPVRDAIRRMDDLDGSAHIRRLAREALQRPSYARALPDLKANATLQVHSIASEFLDETSVERAAALVEKNVPASALESLTSELALPGYQKLVEGSAARALPVSEDWRHAATRFVDHRVITPDMTEHYSSIFSGYESLLHSIGDSLTTAQNPPLGEDALDMIQRDFDQLRRATRLLEPLQALSQAWAGAFGDALTVEMLKNQLTRPFSNHIDSAWAGPYQQFAQLVEDAYWNETDDDANDIDEAADQGLPDCKADTLDSPAEPNVWPVAARIGISYYLLTERLTAVASRMDAGAVGGAATWDRMLLAISYASPAHTHELLALSYPLLQCFSLLSAPAGSVVRGSSESHRLAEIERFEALVEDTLKLLDRIERSIGP